MHLIPFAIASDPINTQTRSEQDYWLRWCYDYKVIGFHLNQMV